MSDDMQKRIMNLIICIINDEILKSYASKDMEYHDAMVKILHDKKALANIRSWVVENYKNLVFNENDPFDSWYFNLIRDALEIVYLDKFTDEGGYNFAVEAQSRYKVTLPRGFRLV